MMNDTTKPGLCPRCGQVIPVEAPQGLCPKCVLQGVATAPEQDLSGAAPAETPSLDRVAAAFPQLEILKLIGRGGMGVVYKARQPNLDRYVALKLLPEHLARDARFAERFNREGRVLARLNHHNIVSVYDFGQAGEFFFLLMEYVDGVNLRQAMQAGRFSPSEALAIVPRICEALQYAHSMGILHRDIKPANILLDSRGHVKIADFGIAKLLGEDQADVTLTATGATLGTPQYMAPEQLEKPAEVDHRADIYSLGVVFYEMLTGELPIGRFAAPSAKTPVGANVDEVVFRTLEKDRERRFQSAGEMKTQVEHLGTQEALRPPGAETRKYSRWSLYGAALVGLSLPAPLLVLLAIVTGRGGVGPGELLLSLGSIALPGLGGTLLGWLGLNEIRDSGGRLRGLPMALFATLCWPLGVLACLTIGTPLLYLARAHSASSLTLLGRMLLLLVPAGVLTFGCWAVYSTAQWAQRGKAARERGFLKWAFIAMLVAGMGLVLASKPLRATRAAAGPQDGLVQPPVFEGEVLVHPWLHAPVMADAPNSIHFTITQAEARIDQGRQWLALDYATHVRGECQEFFRTQGGSATTRKTGLLVTPEGAPDVLRQRFEVQLPIEVDGGNVAPLVAELSHTLVGKSFLVPAGEERPIVRLPGDPASQVTISIGVQMRDPE